VPCDRVLERGVTGQGSIEIPTCFHACMKNETFHIVTIKGEAR